MSGGEYPPGWLSELVSTFVSELRSLSEFCNFRDVMMRDRLICGLNDDALQRRLPDLTYTKAAELAHSMERAAQNIKELKTKPEFSNPAFTSQEVHTVTAPGGNRKLTLTCF